MIRAIRPSAVARDDATLITGWNIAPNVAYTVSLSVSASAVVVLLADADNSGLIGSGLALVGADQPVTIMPMTGQTIGMVDADLGWHLLVTTTGAEGDRTIRIGPAVDLPDEIHPIYTDDDMALARATAAINAGACYVDDVSVTCPLGLGAGIGGVASAPVDGTAVVGQVESVTWSGSPAGTSETAVIRRHTPIAPEAYVPPLPPPILVDDTAETDAVTAASGNVLSNDTGTLTVSAVNGLSANVGEEIAGSAGGVFTIAEDGAWTFDPDGDFASLSGSDTATTSVSYHASNGVSEASATLTVTVVTAATELWTPAEIATVLWLDAADEATIVLNGSTVSEWKDKSGAARNVSQPTASAQPTYKAAGRNGLSVVSFPVSGKFFQQLSIPNTANNMSVFDVIKYASLGVYHNIFEIGNDVKPMVWIDINNRFELNTGHALAVSGYADTYLIAQYSIKTTTPQTAFRANGGTLVTSRSVTVPSWGNPASFYLFNRAGNQTFRGEIAERIWIDGAVSDEIRQKIEGYLAHKWDLTAYLPPDHPYKSAAPTL